jgi:hypothetical protein
MFRSPLASCLRIHWPSVGLHSGLHLRQRRHASHHPGTCARREGVIDLMGKYSLPVNISIINDFMRNRNK